MLEYPLRYLTNLWHFVRSTDSLYDEDDRNERAQQIASMTALFLPIAVCATLLSVVSMAVSGQQLGWNLIIQVVGVAILPLIIVLGKMERTRLLLWLPILMGLSINFINTAVMGPPHVFLAAFSLVPLYGALLLQFRQAIIVSMVSLFLVSLFHIVVPEAGGLPSAALWLGYTVMAITLYFFALIYFVQREAAVRQKLLDQAQMEARLEAAQLYIRNLAHDFRTPLSVIQTSAYIMMRSDDPARRKQKQTTIAAMAQRIQAMLDDTERLTQLQAMRSPKLKAVAVEQLLPQLVARTRASLNRDITLELSLPETAQPVLATPDLLESALSEVLDNAGMFTPEGGHIRVAYGACCGQAEIRVHNTGEHLSDEQIDLLFEPFFRIDEARGMSTGGTGLGLTIAQKAMLLQGGQITLSSEGDSVTTTLQLPLAEQATKLDPSEQIMNGSRRHVTG